MQASNSAMLLCLQDFPTQYDPPLWRAVRDGGALPVRVWYSSGEAPRDEEIERTATWGHAGSSFAETVPPPALWGKLSALQERPAAIIVTGWRQRASQVALAWAKRNGVPVIASSDKTLNEPSRAEPWSLAETAFHAAKARLFDGVFTTGTLGRQQLLSVGVAHEAIIEGLYPVDISYWRARADALSAESRALREATKVGDGPVVVAVCKLSERESPLFVLDCFHEFRRVCPNATLVQVGDGPLRGAFLERAQALGLSGAVTLAGYAPYRDLAMYYGAADVFIHLPRREPWGISVLEAMACGLPVVATTSVGAAADLVVPGTTGGLGYSDDAQSISQALDRVARGDWRAMGRVAAKRVERFDVHTVAADLAKFVATTASRKRAHRSVRSVARSEVLNEFGRWSP